MNSVFPNWYWHAYLPYVIFYILVLDVSTLFLVGNLDPGVSLEMVSQSAEYVSR